MANVKKENLKTCSDEAIDKLINYFQSYECIWNVISGDYKEQNRKPLPLERYDMSVQEYNIYRFDYKKNEIISEANSYYSEAATGGVLYEKVQNPQENTFGRVSISIKLQAWGLQLY